MPVFVAIFFLALTAAFGVLHRTELDLSYAQAKTDVASINVLAYKSAVVAYLEANPGFIGVVNDSDITLPVGMVRDTHWTNLMTASTLYIYEKPPSGNQGLLDSLYSKTNKSILVGQSNGTNLISVFGANTGVLIPVVTPAISPKSIVIVGR